MVYQKEEMWKEVVGEWIRDELRANPHNKKMVRLMSQSPFLPLQTVLDHPHLPWDFHAIRRNPYLTRAIIEAFRKSIYRKLVMPGYHTQRVQLFHGRTGYDFVGWEARPRRVPRMSYHPMLPIALVVRMPNRGWNYQFLLRYRQWSIAQIEILERHHRMDWRVFSRNAFVDVTIVRHFLNAKWDWQYLAQHPSFPPQDVYKDQVLFPRWRWRSVFMNPRITPEFWKAIRARADSHEIYHRPFILMNHFRFSSVMRVHCMLRIQSWYHGRRRWWAMISKLSHLCRVIRPLPDEMRRHIVHFL